MEASKVKFNHNKQVRFKIDPFDKKQKNSCLIFMSDINKTYLLFPPKYFCPIGYIITQNYLPKLLTLNITD